MAKRVKVKKNNKVLDRLEVEDVAWDSIAPNPYNPNRQSEHDFEMLCRSIKSDGFTKPVIVNRASRQIVDGEHRWRALRDPRSGGPYDNTPVVFTDMTAEQMRISTLRHNRARGHEDADAVVELFKELQALGATDYVVEELMLDPVELTKLLELDGSELARAALSPTTDAELGPEGTGLSELDQRMAIDTTSDERRAREVKLRELKKDEEARMGAADNDVYRLMLIYTGPEAETIKRVLHALAPEGEKEPMPAALLRLCRWSEGLSA